ncbi:uncharacterized protein LOC115955566 [Quercus lobata]|uniref:uncharacterized protein LOC115955566 n=1 Tax=Quercus lobata TaxID=97700 RepID=UPI001243F0CA|nr:uncharacterized protein LOC115955566 [Quercus lobata]
MPCEPYFKAFEAKLSFVAVWVRLPKLPMEFYEASILKEIGSVIGPVLHIDSFTASETRGGYARLCVQINLDKPLITSIRIGRLVQRVMYEGVSLLCFNCGRLGHKKESCCYQGDLSQPLEGQRGSEQVKNGRDVKRSNPSAKNRLGYLVQEKSGGDSRRGYSTNSCNTNRDSGLVQGRAGTSMEATIPHNSNEHQNWGSVVGPQCVESHAQPVVEIPHGHSSDFLGSSRGVEQAETAIGHALLGRIQMVNPGKESGGFSGNGYDSYGESHNTEVDPNHGSSAEVRCSPVLQGGYPKHSEVYDNMEAKMESFQKPFEEGGMEYGEVDDNKGALNADFVRIIFEMAINHRPSIMVVTETRVGGDRARKIIEGLPFDGYITTDTVGYAGGLWMLWKTQEVEVSHLSSTEQEIHASTKVHSSNLTWLISAIYASPRLSKRRILWNNLKNVAQLHNLPWLMLGDFNEVLCGEDKFRGNQVNLNRALEFKECLDECNMLDLGFTGPKYTWMNCRPITSLILERIDWCFANPGWRLLYSEAVVTHLPRTFSDHCPVLLELCKSSANNFTKLFRFQTMWLLHPDFYRVVQQAWVEIENRTLQRVVADFVDRVKKWNVEVFGNIFAKKRRVLVRLNGAQKAIAENPNDFLLDLENQLLNKTRCIKDAVGNWLTEDNEVKEHIRSGFINLYTTELRWSTKSSNVSNFSCYYFSDEVRARIDCDVTVEEIRASIWVLKPFKAPGPDGLHAGFYQHFWMEVKNSVCEEIKEIFVHGVVPSYLNETLIALILKCQNPESLSNYRPISLCNSIYKVISKIIVARIRPHLSSLISPVQTTFVPGRRGTHNVIIAQELFRTLDKKKKGRVGYMAIKLDLEKAYDRLEWSFVHKVLEAFRFPLKLTKIIMSCIATTSISVLVNGDAIQSFEPSRGIRQGDPLSPYIFILCMEYLGHLIKQKCVDGVWTPLKASKNNVGISHLLFADDILLFGKVDPAAYEAILEVLGKFYAESGQKISLEKSHVYFSPNVSESLNEEVCDKLGIRVMHDIGKYLGFPLRHRGAARNPYKFIVEKVMSKLTRNIVMFENGISNPKLDKACLGQAREFHFCVSKINQVTSKIPFPVSWNKPSFGWHKLNTDGASIGNPGKAGGGGVIRDCHGDWVKGYSRSIGYTTSVLAEWSLIARFVQVRVRHSFKEVNQCVNFLAKRGCVMLKNFAEFDIPPFADMYILLDSDKNGLYYYRHVVSTLASDYTESSSGTENEEEEEDLMRPSMTMSHDDDELSSPNRSRKINMEETKPTIPKAMAREEKRLRVVSDDDDEQQGTSTTSVKKKAGQDDNMVNNNNGNDVDNNDIDSDDDKGEVEGEDKGEDAVQGDDEQEGRRRDDLRNCADLKKLSME